MINKGFSVSGPERKPSAIVTSYVLLLTLYSTPRYAPPTPFSSRTASTLFSFLYTVALWSHQRDRNMNLPVVRNPIADNERVFPYFAMKLATSDLSTFITYTDKLSAW